MSEFGHIIVGGREVPCAVPVKTWDEHGMHFGVIAKSKRKRTDLVTLHWTGAENPAATMFAGMAKDERKKSVHFFVNHKGEAWQFVDADALAAHARGMNDRAVGIEIQNRADTRKVHRGIERALTREVIDGKEFTYSLFLPAQIRTVLALCASLCEAYELPWQVPMELAPITLDGTVPAHIALPDGISAEAGSGQRLRRVIPRKLTEAELRAHRGMIGHFHWNDRGKRDPGIALLQAVAAFEPRHAQGIGGPAE